MKQVVLDTNFILTCVKQKIDFFNEIRFMGFDVIIPEEVLSEIKKVADSGKKLHLRNNAKLTLKILEKNKFKKVQLKTKNVDKGLLKIAEKNKNVIIATFDRDVKRKIKKPKLVIREKKKLEII